MRVSIQCLAALATVLLAAGCIETAPEASLAAPDYSPNYTYVNVIGANGRVKRVLAPEACLAPAAPSPADQGPPRLPPGCANNYNLQRMVESKRDLSQGRPLGGAPAAPAARAAQNYIDGKEPTLGGAVTSGAATGGVPPGPPKQE